MTPELSALSGRRRVYAVDIVGEAGNSADNRPPLRTDAYADWLGEVLDALGHDSAAVVGNSLGGWIALKFAVTYPQRRVEAGAHLAGRPRQAKTGTA
jgi:pimeloyl-ACP methyl ester carboxylesterase